MFAKKKNNRVYELITDQIKDVETCLIHFESFLLAVTTKETAFETMQALSGSVAQSEAAADTSLRRMIDSLADASLLPSTREELIEIATSCDSIANKCEHAANMIVFQRFRFPDSYAEDIMKIIAITREQFNVLKKSVLQLFMNFSDLLKDHKILDDIRDYESQVDVIEQSLYKKVFVLDMGLAERTQLAKMIEYLSDISDIIENIADKIQIMLITRKA
ncbi:MAG: DUF47 family protein [Clostridia bacterium]|nr:DUF47 family protein [Clostridia bacterium]